MKKHKAYALPNKALQLTSAGRGTMGQRRPLLASFAGTLVLPAKPVGLAQPLHASGVGWCTRGGHA